MRYFRIGQAILNMGSVDITKIDTAKLRIALKQRKNRKSPGEDRLTPEVVNIFHMNVCSLRNKTERLEAPKKSLIVTCTKHTYICI